MGTGTYISATSNNVKLVHYYTSCCWLGCYIWYSDWRGPLPAKSPPGCTKCNSPPINGQLLTSYYSIWHSNCLCTIRG